MYLVFLFNISTNLKIPKTTHFIHKCYIDVARYFWKNSYLFDDKLSNYEKQKNRREAENIIEISINETIRKEIPLKHILKEYLGDDYIEAKSSDLKEDNKLNLRKMVMHEINNCSKEKVVKIFNLHPKLAIEKRLTNFSSKEQIA